MIGHKSIEQRFVHPLLVFPWWGPRAKKGTLQKTLSKKVISSSLMGTQNNQATKFPFPEGYNIKQRETTVQYVVIFPDEKEVNEYFLSKKRSSELKFVL